jgi:hydrogenase maturation protein HypF
MNEEQLIQKNIRNTASCWGSVSVRLRSPCREAGITGTVSNKDSYGTCWLKAWKMRSRICQAAKGGTYGARVILMNRREGGGKASIPKQYREFSIIESAKTREEYFSLRIDGLATPANGVIDPADRRYQHPFINCSSVSPPDDTCSLPYDRERTSMRLFDVPGL